MKPGQPQIFKNRLFENLSTRVSKSEKYKNLENPVSVWSYDEKVWSGRKREYQIERNIKRKSEKRKAEEKEMRYTIEYREKKRKTNVSEKRG